MADKAREGKIKKVLLVLQTVMSRVLLQPHEHDHYVMARDILSDLETAVKFVLFKHYKPYSSDAQHLEKDKEKQQTENLSGQDHNKYDIQITGTYVSAAVLHQQLSQKVDKDAQRWPALVEASIGPQKGLDQNSCDIHRG